MARSSEERQATVLVVDDNPNNRDLIQRRLERSGYAVLVAENGQEALDTVAARGVDKGGVGGGGIDLVVLDIMMPGLSGIDVLGRLRGEHSSVDLPVIMATAKNQSEDVVEALDAGANDYVTKPLDFAILLARVHAHLRSKASAEAASATVEEERYGLSDLGPGVVLTEKYRIESEIGRGNFGVVYRATHLTFQQPVAIKVLSTQLDDRDGESLARFQQEGMSAFRLKHPNACAVLDFCVAHGLAFLVMELLEGQTLEQRMAEQGPLPLEECERHLREICEVLGEGHTLGIIHRDVKPANVFLHQTPRGETVKVLDFGIAKLVGDAADSNLTVDEGILGTPAYMAPERLNGKAYDGKSDVYGVGIMLYQMLSGRLPFDVEEKDAIAIAVQHLTSQPERLRTHLPRVSIAVESVVMSALEKDPAERPTAPQLAQRFAAAVRGDVVTDEGEGESLPAAEPDGGEVDLEDVTATHRLPGLQTRRLTFGFGDFLEPPPEMEAADPPLPAVAPRKMGGTWR